jgi:hypothetical protein
MQTSFAVHTGWRLEIAPAIGEQPSQPSSANFQPAAKRAGLASVAATLTARKCWCFNCQVEKL